MILGVDMSKHTPGPWRLETTTKGVFTSSAVLQRVVTIPVIGKHVGSGVYLSKHVENKDAPDHDEANARLIAAAPDLLEAAKFTLENIDHDACKPDRQPPRKDLCPACDLQKAIAKAEGRSDE